jgi:hypothetical protein
MSNDAYWGIDASKGYADFKGSIVYVLYECGKA